MRRLLSIVLTILILGASCSAGSDSVVSAESPTSEAPSASVSQTDDDWPYQFTVGGLDGSVIDTGDYAGQDLVLWFWAPW